MCDGVESDVAVVEVPSPQLIVYLIFPSAAGTVVIVKVTVSPSEIDVSSETNDTDFT